MRAVAEAGGLVRADGTINLLAYVAYLVREVPARCWPLDLLEFDGDELARLLSGDEGLTQGETDPNAIPEPPDKATTQPGDIWVLGDHRLMCGDSASPQDLDRLLDGQSINSRAAEEASCS